MYSETVKPIKKDQSVLWISLGLVALLIIIVGLSNFLYNRYGINYTGYITFLLYGLIGLYVYKKMIVQYRYSLNKDELIFETVSGKRNKEMIRVDLKKVLYFCPLSLERLDKATDYKSYHATHNKKTPQCWVLAFKGQEKVYRIIFEPSDKLIDLIKNS